MKRLIINGLGLLLILYSLGQDVRMFWTAGSPFSTIMVMPFFLLDALQGSMLLLAKTPRIQGKQTVVPLLAAFLPLFSPLVLHRSAVSFPTVGVLFMVASVFLGLWGIMTLRTCFSILPEGRHLVQEGPYRYIRHPLYASYGLSYLGNLFFYPQSSYALFLLMAYGFQIWRAHMEDAVLAQLGEEVRIYQAQTGMLWPTFRRRR